MLSTIRRTRCILLPYKGALYHFNSANSFTRQYTTASNMTTEQDIKKQKPNDTLKVFLRSENATVPTKGSALAAGYDLYASEAGVIPAHGQGMIGTDLTLIVPYGTYGRVAPRSGLAVKHGISTGAGVVDADYRGEIKIVLFNHAAKDFAVEKGDRIAQLVLEKIVNADVVALTAEQFAEETTVRGEDGFGSTGVSAVSK